MAIRLADSPNRSISDNISGDFEKRAFYIKENVQSFGIYEDSIQ